MQKNEKIDNGARGKKGDNAQNKASTSSHVYFFFNETVKRIK